MAEVDKKVTEMTSAQTMTASDLFYLLIADQQSETGFSSRKATASLIAQAMLNTFEFPLLLTETQSDSIIGAINEIAQGGGGGTASILTGTSAPSSSLGENGNLYVQYTEGTGGASDVVDAMYVKLDGEWIEIATSGGSGIGTKLTGTLTAGTTSVSFSDASITSSSLIDVYTSTGISPTSYTVSTGSLTLTFASQGSDVAVAVLIDARGSESLKEVAMFELNNGQSALVSATAQDVFDALNDGKIVILWRTNRNQTFKSYAISYYFTSTLVRFIELSTISSTKNTGLEFYYLEMASDGTFTTKSHKLSELPTGTSSDIGKVLTYQGTSGNNYYAWSNAPSPSIQEITGIPKSYIVFPTGFSRSDLANIKPADNVVFRYGGDVTGFLTFAGVCNLHPDPSSVWTTEQFAIFIGCSSGISQNFNTNADALFVVALSVTDSTHDTIYKVNDLGTALV